MALAVLFISAVISCTKETSIIDPNNAASTTDLSSAGKDDGFTFQKDVQIRSANAQATIRVFARSNSDLDQYDATNFKLVEILGEESLEAALVRQEIMNPDEGKNREEANDPLNVEEAEVLSSFGFQLIEVSNADPNRRYAVSFLHPEDNSRASWQYFTHYSTAQQNLEQNCDIARHSFWRKVYHGLKYRAYSSSNWSVIQSEWRKLSNNQTMSYTKNPCFQYRARVKTKKSSAYTVSFY